MTTVTQSSDNRFDELDIDWKRTAEPQKDQYDTQVTLEFAKQAGYQKGFPPNLPTFFEGEVAIRQDRSVTHIPECVPAEPDHPNVNRGSELLRLWAPVYRQFQTLTNYVALLDYTPHPVDLVVGSVCGAGDDGFGTIAATINHHVGFAEALVHEMAHHKLRALGVDLEKAGRLILNPPDQTFQSPIRYDCLRPMSAVFHAQYSYTYVLGLDLKIIHAELDRERDRIIVENSLAIVLPKLEFGLQIIKEQAILDSPGKDFVKGLDTWSRQIFSDGSRILNEFEIRPQPFFHPCSSSR